jgi:hypothetical protein
MTAKGTFCMTYFIVQGKLGLTISDQKVKKCHMGGGGGGSKKTQKSVTYYLNVCLSSIISNLMVPSQINEEKVEEMKTKKKRLTFLYLIIASVLSVT